MIKRIIAIAAAATLTLAIAGCAQSPQEGPERQENPSDTAILSLRFEDTGNQTLDAAGQAYPVHHVFSDAKYQAPESAARVPGVAGTALRFDGYSTYVEAMPITADTGALTVSLWVAPRAFATRTDGRHTGLISCLGSAGGFELKLGNYGKWGFEVITNKGSYKLWSEETLVDLYRWNYLTAVFDGQAGQMTLYKNGQQVASCTVTADTVKGSDMALRIGKGSNPSMVEEIFDATMFGGLMDEVQIRHEALSAEAVAGEFEAHAEAVEREITDELWLSPETLADDRYAPQYHLRVAQNWQNETYGFFYYNGYYHTFCQQNVLGPYYTEGQRWGHFVSEDLVHWQEQIPALLPEENGRDDTHIFSGGAAILPSGEPMLFYTAVNYGNQYLNLISTASPADLSDPLLTDWNKSGKVVVDQGDISTLNNFRDPFIYEENGEYFMLIGGTDKVSGGGAVYCYRAADDSLENWEYLSMLHTADPRVYPYLGNCYELPNLFLVKNEDGTVQRHLLMISPIGDINGVYYWLGDFDPATGSFTPEQAEPMRYDLGPKSQVLCPSGFYDAGTDRNLLITMSRTGMDAQERWDSGWATVMTLIKELKLSDEGTLIVRPIEEYRSLEKQCLLRQENTELSVKEANELLRSIHGDQLRIELVIDPKEDSEVGLYVKYDAQGAERVDISYEPEKAWLQIDTSKSSTDMRNNGAGGGTVELSGEEIRLTVFVDRAMVEAYLNDRNQVTAFGYNVSHSADGLLLHSSGSTAVIKSICVYELGSSTGTDVPAFWQ